MNKENYVILKTIEECGELVQALCKIYTSKRPDLNRDIILIKNIQHEMGDVLGCIDYAIKTLHLNKKEINSQKKIRQKNLKK